MALVSNNKVYSIKWNPFPSSPDEDLAQAMELDTSFTNEPITMLRARGSTVMVVFKTKFAVFVGNQTKMIDLADIGPYGDAEVVDACLSDKYCVVLTGDKELRFVMYDYPEESAAIGDPNIRIVAMSDGYVLSEDMNVYNMRLDMLTRYWSLRANLAGDWSVGRMVYLGHSSRQHRIRREPAENLNLRDGLFKIHTVGMIGNTPRLFRLLGRHALWNEDVLYDIEGNRELTNSNTLGSRIKRCDLTIYGSEQDVHILTEDGTIRHTTLRNLDSMSVVGTGYSNMLVTSSIGTRYTVYGIRAGDEGVEEVGPIAIRGMPSYADMTSLDPPSQR